MPVKCGKESCFGCADLACNGFVSTILVDPQQIAENLAKQSPPPTQDHQRGRFGRRGHITDEAPKLNKK